MKLPGPLDSTVGYVIVGVILAFLINQGMALALSTNMPIVAVESNSMVPTFHKGDILVLYGTPAEELEVGDIIVFQPEAGAYASTTDFISGSASTIPIVHRIIRINPDGSFQTKGDANPGQLSFEKHIEPSQIYGESILIIPYLGWVKIGITEFVVPNILWIAIALIAAYAVSMKLPKHIKTPLTRYMTP
jgi:signal peptidase